MIRLFAALFVAAVISIGCTSNNEAVKEEQNDNIHIVTSMFPMYEITKEIAGDRAEVSVMVGANEDAHHYEPSAKAVASVNEADVFVYSSDEMEFWVKSLLSVVENDDLIVVELGDGIDFEIHSEHDDHDHVHEDEDHSDHDHGHEDEEHSDHDDGHNHGTLDPHFWLNPVSVESQLQLIVDALLQVDEEGQEMYAEQAVRFSEELLTLDQMYQEAFQSAENRSFVVQHQAFGHLAHQYDLEQVAIGGLTTEVEPNPKQLAHIVKFINEQKLPVIYYQSGSSSSIAETISNETGTGIGVLYDLESLPAGFSDSERPYIEAMKENLEQLKKSIN